MMLTGDIIKYAFAFLLVLTVIVTVYFKRKFSYWRQKNVPHHPPMIPFGNAKDFFLRKFSFGDQFRDAYIKYKTKGLKYFGYYLLGLPTLIIIDPELIKIIFTKDFQYFTDHNVYLDEEREPLTGHLFLLKGLKWKNVRARLSPTFSSGKMKMMFQTVVDCSKGLIDVIDGTIEERKALDIKDVFSRYTTDVIGSCAFGLDCNSLRNPNSEFRNYGKKIFGTSTKEKIARILSITSPSLLKVFSLKTIDEGVTKFFMNLIKQTVAYRENNNVLRKDFIHLLIQLKNNVDLENNEDMGSLKENSKMTNTGKSLSMNEISAQAFVFFFAGFETSSTTLTFCFYELATNPEIQEKLRIEIRSALERHQGRITYDAIMEMHYMDKCVQETLRKYPPVSTIPRVCTKMYKMPNSDLVIEKGLFVLIPILEIQRDPDYYPDPEKFDPERFNSGNKAKRHPFTWLPFGEGPRTCIGLRFAMLQIKVAMTLLLENYKFMLNPKTQTPLKLDPRSPIPSVQGGIWLNAENIQK